MLALALQSGVNDPISGETMKAMTCHLFSRPLIGSGTIFLACLLMAATQLAAQGTAFTYQGQLKENGSPANGNYDLTFAIFDDANSGSQVGVTITSAPTAVSNGLFTVTLDFGPGIFPGSARWLETSVRTNGSVGSYSTLSPRQPLTASPYAITAGSVTGPINGSSIVNGSITGAQLANGAVGANQLATGAAAANLGSAGQSGVASGGVILSADANSTTLLNAGYVKLGQAELRDLWQQRGLNFAPTGRSGQTAVWTGTEMIIWGGADGVYFNTGARYNPAANSWTATTTTGAPVARSSHSAVWKNGEMIVWGGLTPPPLTRMAAATIQSMTSGPLFLIPRLWPAATPTPPSLPAMR